MEKCEDLSESIKAAEEYLEKLSNQKSELHNAETQIKITAENTLKDIDEAFSSLVNKINDVLTKRKTELRKQTIEMRDECLRPLQECQMLINCKNAKIEEYIQKGRNITAQNTSKNEILRFQAEASKFGSIPAVPTLEEAPFLTFQYTLNGSFEEFLYQCSTLGSVSMMGPVQITATIEKPGGLYIEWQPIDSEDKNIDVQSYRLQYAFGNVKENPQLITNFHDCYVGQNTQCTVRDLKPNQLYTFRVCCQSDGQDIWSAWSYLYISSTSLHPFIWQNSTAHYQVTNEKKLATKISEEKSILYSEYAQIEPEQSIEFTILKANNKLLKNQGLGLIDPLAENITEDLICPGTLVLASTGHIFVDGQEKLTQLPKFKDGCKVTFFFEKLSDKKLRVNIDCENKTVTYDWSVCSVEACIKFAICFEGVNWKILVE